MSLADENFGAMAHPEHDKLYKELGTVRTRGFGNLADRLADLKGLVGVARVVGVGANDTDKIEDAVRQAVRRLGGIGTASMEALFGMGAKTRSLNVTERRTKAAELYDYKSYELFRTRFEPSLLMFVATYLRVLVDERRLAEREQTVAERERFLAHSQAIAEFEAIAKIRTS
jgi:hypothetical protein